MKDWLMIIYERLRTNVVIAEKVGPRIKFYKNPQSADTSKDFIRMSYAEPPRAATYASNEASTEEMAVQIDVETYERMTAKVLQSEVNKELRKLNLTQEPGGLDDYFEETARYVDSRRYSGRPYFIENKEEIK